MKAFSSVIVFVCVIGYSVAQNGEALKVTKVTDGIQEILKVSNSDGEVLAIINVNQDDDYQLIKPTAEDDYVCLVFPAKIKKSELHECYERMPFQRDEDTAIYLEECGDREIFVLRPAFKELCSDEIEQDDNDATRQRRHDDKRCNETPTVVESCVEYAKVCRQWGWIFEAGKCKKEVYVCKKQQAIVVYTVTCQ